MEGARKVFAQDPSVPFKPNPCPPGVPAAAVPPAPGALPYSEDILNTLIAIREDLDAIKVSLQAPAQKTRWYNTPTTAITVATPVQPSSPDIISNPTTGTSGYQRETVYATLERIAPKLTVINDGTDTIFVITTTDGSTWSSESPILQGEKRILYNVFEMRLRSPTAGNLTAETGGIYRATELDLWPAYVKLITPGAFIPINKASVVGQLQPVANADILLALTGASLTATNTPTTFRVMVAMSNVGTFSASINDGVNPVQVVNFNVVPGPNLVASGLYEFDMQVQANWTVDFRYSVTGGTILVLSVQELDAAAA